MLFETAKPARSKLPFDAVVPSPIAIDPVPASASFMPIFKTGL